MSSVNRGQDREIRVNGGLSPCSPLQHKVVQLNTSMAPPDPYFTLQMNSLSIWVWCRFHAKQGLQELNHPSQSQSCISCGAGIRRWPIEECQRAAVWNNQDHCHWCGQTGRTSAMWGIIANQRQSFTGVPAAPHAIFAGRFVDSRLVVVLLYGCSSDWLYVYWIVCRQSFVYVNWMNEKTPDEFPVLNCELVWLYPAK